MELRHVGIAILLIGTLVLAFSVKQKRLYDDDISHVVNNLNKQNPKLREPTETTINLPMFCFGLVLVAIGSLLQWA